MSDKQTFFASSNSANGFQSYFDSIYNSKKMEKIYIIKGGPGTGKSHLMKSIGDHFDKKVNTEYFLCSSDPNSLDGIILDNRIALIDGTSPHAVEAKYPGAVEVIVDTGKGISDRLKKYKNEIFELNDKKSSLYKIAYSYLRSAGELKTGYAKIISEKYYIDKLEGAVNRFFKQNIKKGDGYNQTVRLVEGITPVGIINTGTFERLADKKCIISNPEGFDSLIFNMFLKKSKEYGLKVYTSFDPLLPYTANGLYFPEGHVSVTCYSREIHGEMDYDKYKVFNSERFINKDVLSENRAKLRFSHKCKKALIDEAIIYLSEASKIHKSLEELYIENMDYDLVKTHLKEIINEIQLALIS